MLLKLLQIFYILHLTDDAEYSSKARMMHTCRKYKTNVHSALSEHFRQTFWLEISQGIETKVIWQPWLALIISATHIYYISCQSSVCALPGHNCKDEGEMSWVALTHDLTHKLIFCWLGLFVVISDWLLIIPWCHLQLLSSSPSQCNHFKNFLISFFKFLSCQNSSKCRPLQNCWSY